MTQSPNQRLDAVEDRLERVEQLLVSTASYAESANRGLAQTQTQLNQLSSRVDEFVFQAQRLFTQQGERLIRVDGLTESLTGIVQRLDRNYQTQQSQFLEFQRTTNAALERIDRVLDYLLRQQGDNNRS